MHNLRSPPPERLQSHEDWKIQGQRTRARVRWRQHGDKGSKEFYTAVRPKSGPSATLTGLLDSHGILQTSQEGMQSVCHIFYSTLYARRQISQDTLNRQLWAFEGFPSKLTPQMTTALQRPITLAELSAALTAMANGKSPGPDGVTVEFFKCLWPTMGPEYHNMILQAVAGSSLPNGGTEGLIILFSKGGIHESLNNWRPITLLNVSYKILAKALQMRLQSVLMEVISSQRFCRCGLFLTTFS